MHGGTQPRGLAASGFKHGRYSKVLPARLMAQYEESRNDPELLSLRDEAAVLQSRISDLLGRADTGESRRFWAAARQAMDDFDEAMSGGDPSSIRLALGNLRETINGGFRDWQTWEELQRTIDLHRKVTESERKRLVDMHAMVSADEALAFAGALVSVVRQHVEDPKALQAIQTGMQKVFEARRAQER